ncbi:MAG: hypothetical protein B7Z79_12035 [Thiomonas sp. 20-64-9]|nr:MAG: hypothetical protein B7Z79_12035 [Thiomonas sp. 20-64-9]
MHGLAQHHQSPLRLIDLRHATDHRIADVHRQRIQPPALLYSMDAHQIAQMQAVLGRGLTIRAIACLRGQFIFAAVDENAAETLNRADGHDSRPADSTRADAGAADAAGVDTRTADPAWRGRNRAHQTQHQP